MQNIFKDAAKKILKMDEKEAFILKFKTFFDEGSMFTLNFQTN